MVQESRHRHWLKNWRTRLATYGQVLVVKKAQVWDERRRVREASPSGVMGKARKEWSVQKDGAVWSYVLGRASRGGAWWRRG